MSSGSTVTWKHCRLCRAPIMVLGTRTVSSLCSDCQEGNDSRDEIQHSSRIRCPHCKHQMSIAGDDLWELYKEGSHDVACQECDKEFAVETAVRYTFTSPALVEQPAEPVPSEE